MNDTLIDWFLPGVFLGVFLAFVLGLTALLRFDAEQVARCVDRGGAWVRIGDAKMCARLTVEPLP